jgi:hypothetical protein
MTPKPRKAAPEGGEARMVKTTLEMPEELWKAAKVRAIEEGDLRTVMIRALEAYLGQPIKAKKGGK